MKHIIKKLWEELDSLSGAEADSDLDELREALAIVLEFTVHTAASKRLRLAGDIDSAMHGERLADHCLACLYHMTDPDPETEN